MGGINVKVSSCRLDRVPFKLKEDIYNSCAKVIDSGYYILGPQVEKFESEFSKYIGTKYCVGVASGLDALYLAFRALSIGPGYEVIV